MKIWPLLPTEKHGTNNTSSQVFLYDFSPDFPALESEDESIKVRFQLFQRSVHLLLDNDIGFGIANAFCQCLSGKCVRIYMY